MTRVGWIGLGAMGAPMAVRLVRAGFEVTAFDVNPRSVTDVAAQGVGAGAGSAAVAEGADVLVVMVATPDQADSVLFGPDGAAGSLAPGSTVMIMSTVGPAAVEAIASRLEQAGVSVVDAPVSGGVARAGSGDLLAMVSGAPEALAVIEPLLSTMASTVSIVGDAPGVGQKVKLVNQLLCGVHIAAAAEALAYAETLGLDPAATYEVIRHGAAASFMLDDRGRRMVAAEGDEVRSAIDIFVKDLGLVTGAVEDAESITPLASTARALFREGSDAGLGRRDDSRVIDVLRARRRG
ncbi:MAG: NAD(P)-dependent oxidoreductase [Microbacterium sp.]|uniref:NAD(P)-dependent oxidoreductase n=1 Tax=Microbacterium sp. TaxID=51671 RepID=UPI0039E71103